MTSTLRAVFGVIPGDGASEGTVWAPRAAQPELLILYESTASLDVSVQDRMLDLLAEPQRELGHTFLFIAQASGRAADEHHMLVLYDDEGVEYRRAADWFTALEQKYTRTLLARPAATPRSAG